MGYVIKKGTGGGGGGDATAANQSTQITIANNAAATQAKEAYQLVQNNLIDNSAIPSVFKDTTISKSVFTSIDGTQSLLYKTLENTGPTATSNPNVIQSISFTDPTAAGASNLLNAWLSSNSCFICGLTATQGGGTHDLYLLYST